MHKLIRKRAGIRYGISGVRKMMRYLGVFSKDPRKEARQKGVT